MSEEANLNAILGVESNELSFFNLHTLDGRPHVLVYLTTCPGASTH